MTELQNSKIAFLLSTCIRFSHKFYKCILKKYEKNKIVATLHNFDLCIRFNEFVKDDDSDFSIRDTDFYFYDVNSDDTKNVFSEWLQMQNNKFLSKSEITCIWDKLVSKNINLNVYQFIPILTIATLIKMYKNKYKYLFIPVIINYGIPDNKICHQTALIIDFTGKILFYEPYGQYIKVNKSYAKCITELFSIYESFVSDETITDTYHNYIYSPSPNEYGIQYFIKKKNNEFKSFDENYEKLVTRISDIISKYDIKNNGNPLLLNIENNSMTDLNNNRDQTLTSVYVLAHLSNINLDSPCFQNNEFLTQFKEIYNEALCLYYNYNAQTCVTITIYEIDIFFKIVDEHYSELVHVEELYQKHRNYLLDLYKTFKDSDHPNKLLLTNLNEILDDFELLAYKKTPSNVNIKTIMKNRIPNSNTCKMFRYDIE
jgi:hypothetical protein